MAGVSETIVREFFELHDFLVRQPRKYVGPGRSDEGDDVDFFVVNPNPVKSTGQEIPFVLGTGDLPLVERAIVVVKAWHTEIFSPGRLASAPEILKFLKTKFYQQAARAFGAQGTLARILVVPALPQDRQTRAESVSILRSNGLDAVIPFPTILAALIDQVETNRNYQKSDVLQTIRILKNYEFIREPQMELFKVKRKARAGRNRPKACN